MKETSRDVPCAWPQLALQQPACSRAPRGSSGQRFREVSPPPTAPKGVKRPRWQLCFRLDGHGWCGLMDGDTAQGEQRDFFISIIDPPVHSMMRPPAPFFASEIACRVADLLVGRSFLEHLPGRSFEGRTFAAVGKDCLTAGLAAGMLGAKVALVCERHLLRHVQQNVRLYLRDTLDYTSTKSPCVRAVSCNPGHPTSIAGPVLCEQLRAAPTLDVAVVTETAIPCLAGSAGVRQENDGGHGIPGFGANGPRLFEALGELVPAGAPTRVLLICDRVRGLDPISGSSKEGEGSAAVGDSESDDENDNVPRITPPPEWHAKVFCHLSPRVPAVWLERHSSADSRGGISCSLRRHVSRARGEWQGSQARLREALAVHNRWKQGEAAAVLEEAAA
eukprot:CAMPEP_0179043342 /NCGR_PEP_ID=MMETSP0796-20121207/17117_1 /TAXON_ID=73915 /ORGANISM="Pyrodinium bahamense, Strain pbaha01" /LENGTH=390 /DNA_ID=CAMNT_0020739723 /DNA_START=164 /DNA_END=1332 /DNA_ORIENTATION=-